MSTVILVVGIALACPSPPIVSSQSFMPQDDDVVSYTKVGQEMPSFTVTDLNGTPFSITALKGKVLLVNFWATWCSPCRAEMPRLEKQIWRKFKSDDFVMIAIAREETDQVISEYRKRYRYSFPMASDPNREVYKLFGDGGIPRTYVVGIDGKILYQSVGYNPSEFGAMTKVIEKELKKLPKPKTSERVVTKAFN